MTGLRPAERAAATIAGVKCGVVRDLSYRLTFFQFSFYEMGQLALHETGR